MNQIVSSNVAQSKRSKIYTESDRSARSVLVGFKGEWRAYKSFWEETTGWHLEAICVAV